MNHKHDVPIITIDGPSGTGKGTLAIALTKQLGFRYLDSGALYRAVGYGVLQAGIAVTDDLHIEALMSQFDIEMTLNDKDQVRVRLNGQDVSQLIREEKVGLFASDLAKKALVRRELLTLQRKHAQLPGLVTDGRDMGTVVFPEATLKIFLTADPAIRAERRFKQLKHTNRHVSLRQVEDDLNIRDKQDTDRAVSPLRPATGAVTMDTTQLSPSDVLANALKLWNKLRS